MVYIVILDGPSGDVFFECYDVLMSIDRPSGGLSDTISGLYFFDPPGVTLLFLPLKGSLNLHHIH